MTARGHTIDAYFEPAAPSSPRPRGPAAPVVRRGLPGWHEIAGQFLVVPLHDRTLMVFITTVPGTQGFAVAALETVGAEQLQPIVPDGAMAAAAVMYDDHAHAIVGDYPELEGPDGARAAAETYARDWLKKHVRDVRCGCGPIGKGKARRTRGRRAA